MKKTVLITGSAKGIGKACIEKFAREGYNVVINYLTSEKEAVELKNAVEKLYGIKALCIKADISNEAEVKNMIAEIISVFSKIDVLVNNANYEQDNHYTEKTKEEFLRVLEVNVVGTFLVTKYASKYMDNGAIVNISSTNSINSYYPFSADYDASKAGVISLTRNFAKILSPYVQVNTIAPGWTKTEPVLEMNPNYIKEEEEKILLKRFAEPEEIANVVAFLASDDASYINNSIIRVDGGI